MADRVDLIIRNARLIDGTGASLARGDIAVADDRIAGLGDLGEATGSIEIDAAGKAVAPGFIDVHTHDDRALLVDPMMAPKVSQGVTTVVTGNCGVSLAPLRTDRRPPPPLDLVCPNAEGFFADFGDYLAALDAEPAAVNALCQVGHASLRVEAMDTLDRPATTGETPCAAAWNRRWKAAPSACRQACPRQRGTDGRDHRAGASCPRCGRHPHNPYA